MKPFLWAVKMYYYQHNIGDFDKKTRHLTRIERSVYLDMIHLYYTTEQALPTDVAMICRKVLARTEEERAAVLAILDEFFLETATGWFHDLCEEELAAYRKTKSQASAAGLASAAAKQARRQDAINGKSTTVVTVVQQPFNGGSTERQRSVNQPITNNQEPITNEPGTGNQVGLDKTTTSVKTAGEKQNATGTRLPADWKPNLADIDYCKTERPDLLPSRVASNFYDYWIAIPGAKGRKLDWSATWRGWVRKESAASAGRTAPAANQRLSTAEQNALNNVAAMKILEGQPQTSDFDEMRTIDV